MRELRCTGRRSNGMMCGALLARVGDGECLIEIKCYRGGCKHLNTFEVKKRVKENQYG